MHPPRALLPYQSGLAGPTASGRQGRQCWRGVGPGVLESPCLQPPCLASHKENQKTQRKRRDRPTYPALWTLLGRVVQWDHCWALRGKLSFVSKMNESPSGAERGCEWSLIGAMSHVFMPTVLWEGLSLVPFDTWRKQDFKKSSDSPRSHTWRARV